MQIIGKRNWEIEKKNLAAFLKLEWEFWRDIVLVFIGWLLVIKDWSARLMYRQRGRFSQSFVNTSMAIMAFLAVSFSGVVEDMIFKSKNTSGGGSSYLIMATDGDLSTDTLISKLPKGEITEYRVLEGDTISGIAAKFGVSIDTIIWENSLKSVDSIKPKQVLRILPDTGLRHKVKRGETIFSIAKYFSVDAQNIVDYPFNTFSNDETFALTAGQELFIPDGVKPKEIVVDTGRYAARTVAPIPGVVGEGTFNWPTSGRITQRYYWYHPAVDIASGGSPAIVAAQGGTVVTAGWNGGGYGNYVIINHGNGYQTLYAHMVTGSLTVSAGDKVSQGQRLGAMGSTGRSTGPHLHFEIISDKGKLNPLTVLK
jgi:murein DD-endopeptidase MepM/ murein hydrolase activator NlpD